MNSDLWVQLSAQLFSLLVGIVSFKKKSVSVSGLIALVIISGLLIWLNEIALLFVLFFMFASSSLLTKYKKSQKEEFEKIVGKAGPRDYIQAISNLGIATLMILLHNLFREDFLLAAATGSVAAANADSWSSELGALSKKQPVMITTFKPTEKGVSGGVTLVGLAGGVAGSLFITVIAAGVLYLGSFSGNILLLSIATLIAGAAGCIIDSYLGAIFQSLYKDQSSNAIIEIPAKNHELIKGVSWMNNDMVNFITTIAGAIIGGAIYYCWTV